ncbi:MAG: phosphate ABC transporter ATP-binding protein [Chlamydiota bacterium]|nr:phosphate ABC transporter ATP-binding protein [Chlamydiota bacterium]
MVNKIKFSIESLNVYFDKVQAIKNLCLEVYNNEILGIIGPANSGKTSFLRCLNRLNELNPSSRMEGKISMDSTDIVKGMKAENLRKKVGMIFALPIPLPMSIFNNIAYGPRRHGIKNKKTLQEIVEKTLQASYLWEEVKDRLDTPAMKLSGGQQQRLCIARTLAVSPEVILFDEPCSGLDPISTAKVEEAMVEMKKHYTIVLVTNNIKQAARVADRTAFFLSGELIELNQTDQMFTAPADERTDGYISGRFG